MRLEAHYIKLNPKLMKQPEASEFTSLQGPFLANDATGHVPLLPLEVLVGLWLVRVVCAVRSRRVVRV